MTTPTFEEPCDWCGTQHDARKCPMIAALEYHPSGKVKRVEFFATGGRVSVPTPVPAVSQGPINIRAFPSRPGRRFAVGFDVIGPTDPAGHGVPIDENGRYVGPAVVAG